MSKTNHGTIIVEAGTESFTLKPTLRAVRTLENRFGGLLPAMQQLGAANLTATAYIIAAGAGIDLNKRKELEAVEEAVFEGGVNKVGAQVLPFVKALLNPGGKTDDELEAMQGNDQSDQEMAATSTNSSE
ncbi:hypothetical protein [Pseudomonas alabamensis]|uniref:hypothetical protein n=1 Tax=Pseudomonas alabamensis TaxID=3064349 RepID=UPI003F64A4F4